METWHLYLAEASSSLGRLDGSARVLPNKELFIDAYVKKEAVLSSQIEGTRSSLSDLFRYEQDGTVAQGSDVVEVSNYVKAMEHGIARLRGDFPLSNRLIREIHQILLSQGVGENKTPGEFRRSQVWLGGTRPGNATFVPPPHTHVADCMGHLEIVLARELMMGFLRWSARLWRTYSSKRFTLSSTVTAA